MNPKVQTIQDKINALAKERGSLRGKQIIICGHCYQDQDNHYKHCAFRKGSSQDLGGLIAPDSCPLSIYESGWAGDESGHWRRKV